MTSGNGGNGNGNGRKKKKSRRRLAVAAIAIALVAVFGLMAMRNGTEIDPSQLATIERGDVARSVVATGKIQPLTKVAIKSKASGIVENLLVHYGDTVETGQVLAELDKELLHAGVRGAEANLLAAEAAYERNRVEVLKGEARFASPQAIEVELAEGGQQRVEAEHFIIATGSRPYRPPEVDFDHDRFGQNLSRDMSGSSDLLCRIGRCMGKDCVFDILSIQVFCDASEFHCRIWVRVGDFLPRHPQGPPCGPRLLQHTKAPVGVEPLTAICAHVTRPARQ